MEKGVDKLKRLKLLLIGMLVLAAGCSSNQSEPQTEQEHQPEPKEVALTYNLAEDEFPDVVNANAGPEVLEAYRFAAKHPEVLDYMPCYCGCYDDVGHESNTHCFIDSVEGNVAYLDTMGFG